jgi:methyl-accepting chemotaxis protein
MSIISKALKKAEASRQNLQKEQIKEIVYLSEAPQSWPKTMLMALLTLVTLMTIFISMTAITLTMKNSQTSKSQKKMINDTDYQIRFLNTRLNEEIKGLKARVGQMTATEKDHYASLKDALVDGKQQISSLEGHTQKLENQTQKLDQKIEAISASISQANSQAKDPAAPTAGN